MDNHEGAASCRAPFVVKRIELNVALTLRNWLIGGYIHESSCAAVTAQTTASGFWRH
jgi:hypothetical protein